MPEKQDFQIPQELRELAEKRRTGTDGLRSAHGIYDIGTVGAWSTVPSTMMASGFKVVQERSIQFAKETVDAGFTLASELAKAKDLQDILRLRSNFADTDAVQRAAGARAWRPHGGGMRSQQAKG